MLEVLALVTDLVITPAGATELELDKNWHSAIVPIETKQPIETKYQAKRVHKTYQAPKVQQQKVKEKKTKWTT
jgi:hypothetical protein